MCACDKMGATSLNIQFLFYIICYLCKQTFYPNVDENISPFSTKFTLDLSHYAHIKFQRCKIKLMHIQIFHFSEPMKDSLVKTLNKEQPTINENIYGYHYGRTMWNITYHILHQFYMPSMQKLATLLGDEKWLWRHQIRVKKQT